MHFKFNTVLCLLSGKLPGQNKMKMYMSIYPCVLILKTKVSPHVTSVSNI